MSGRIRTIKPELLDDAMTAGLSDCAFRLFIASVILADDYGNLRWEPAWLRAQVFWKVERPLAEVESAVAELQTSRLIVAYVIADQRYAAIRNWEKHQKVSHPGKPRVPRMPENVAPSSGSLPPSSGGSPETLLPDLRSQTKTLTETPTTDPPRAERRFEPGTASAEAARESFTQAVAKATTKPFRLATAPFHARDLCGVLNTFAPAGTALESLAWLEVTVEAWVGATDARYASGWAPSKLLDWLNADKPDKREITQVRNRGRADTRQPMRDPNPEWLQRAANGDNDL